MIPPKLLSACAALPLLFIAASAALPEGTPVESRSEVNQRVAALTDIGRQMFRDVSLSGSSQMACASCHDPNHEFGPPNALAVQKGGPDMRSFGTRAVPSLKYLQAVPAFTEHFFDSEDDGDESVDAGPTGGLTWDGRVDRGREQARTPLFSAIEMANTSEAEIVAKVAKAPYAAAMQAVYGKDLFADPAKAFGAVLEALEVYEQDYREFYPYSSKYDAYLAGKAELTAQEQHGLDLFNDEAKGNCASCHISARANNGRPPIFTDYGMIAIGVPRDHDIPANADPNYYDLGLCGPERTTFRDRPEYCGLFRTPSLRNVATRQTFFHNGELHDLREAVAFYATRDSDPGRWYPKSGDGSVEKYDDLPARYQGNINQDPPFGRKAGDPPALTDPEIDDVVAFLKTLTDGYTPQ